MATGEGSFPKSGNDPLFNSEVNTFNPKVFGSKNQFFQGAIGSAPYGPLGGSIFYNPTDAGNWMSSHMQINAFIFKGDDDRTFETRLRISGATINTVLGSKTQGATTLTTPHYYDHILTSGTLTGLGGNVGSGFFIYTDVKIEVDNTNLAYGDFTATGF